MLPGPQSRETDRSAAKPFIPELRDLREVKVAAVEETIQSIETATEQPKFRSIEALLPNAK